MQWWKARFFAASCFFLVASRPADAGAESRRSGPFDGARLLRELLEGPDFVDVADIPGVRVDLRYAGPRNALGKDLYGGFNRALLHRDAAEKLARAAERLRAERPDWSLVVFDGLRPRRVQRNLWREVRGTPREKYVADPRSVSLHNYGLAVDVSLSDGSGRPADMGTEFDDFRRLSEPRLEERHLKAGKLTQAQVENRRLLRRVMTDAGFRPLSIEWWHFNACSRKEAGKGYTSVE